MWQRSALLFLAVAVSAELQELADDGFCLPLGEGEEGLELLQRRAASIMANDTHHEEAAKTGAANASTALTREEHLRAGLAAYALLPSLAAVGLPILVNGCGVMEVAAAGAFWLLIRPAAAMLQALQKALGPPVALRIGVPPLRSPSLGFVPEALSAAAHFYWSWGLCEFAVRRRPFIQRFTAVLLLGLLLLPVPFAQFYLGHISAAEVSACAILGEFLGVMFFFSLRTVPSRGILKALPSHETWLKVLQSGDEAWACFYLYDNLTHWWGGCRWPVQRKSQPAAGLPSKHAMEDKAAEKPEEELPVDEGKNALEEDFEVVPVCQTKRAWIEVVDSVEMPSEVLQVSGGLVE